MKKSGIISIALALLISLYALSACAANDSNAGGTGSDTNSSEPTASQSDAVSDVTASEEAASEPDTSPAEEVDYIGIANELFGALNQIDRLGGTAVPYDDTVTYTEGETVFYLLPKMPYSSVAELKEYMESYLTVDMIASRYSGLIGGDNPLYIDHDGELYVRPNAKGCGFAFYEDGKPSVFNQSDSTFTAQMDYDNFGEKSTLEIEVIKDGDFWKINSFSVK